MDPMVSLPEDTDKERWFEPKLRDVLLFCLSLLIVLQIFLILFLVSQMMFELIEKYVCPQQVIKESDIDVFYDNLEKEPILVDTTDQFIDIIFESLKLLILWIGLLSVINVIEGLVGVVLFSLMTIFFMISNFMTTPIFSRKYVGNDFSDRIENYSQIFVILCQIVVSFISIVTLWKAYLNVSHTYQTMS